MLSLRNFFGVRSIARNLNTSNLRVASSLEKLTTGKRINRASDDAMGLAISKRLTAQISSLDTAYDNTQSGISLLSVIDGAISELFTVLNRMNTLATRAATDTYTDAEREIMDNEFSTLKDDIERITDSTTFNTKQLLSGDYAPGNGEIVLQVGANQGDEISFNVKTTTSAALGVSSLSINDQNNAGAALTGVQSAIQVLASRAADIGAISNRLETASSFNRTLNFNYQSSLMHIEDTDYATEMINLTKAQMLAQAGAIFLAQANLHQQSVFSMILSFGKD